MLPQAPQLRLSAVVLTQPPFGHRVGVVVPQLFAHVPEEHTHDVVPGGSGIVVQLVPHVPQLVRSDMRLTQRPAHIDCPVGHAQAPFVHCWPPAQTVPQAPQFVGLFCKLTHAPLQFVSPTPASLPQKETGTQAPFKQTSVVAAQAVPQAPQFFGSVPRLTQTPAHVTLPGIGQGGGPASRRGGPIASAWIPVSG